MPLRSEWWTYERIRIASVAVLSFTAVIVLVFYMLVANSQTETRRQERSENTLACM